MSTIVGNLERRLAAYAEEQKEKKTRSNPTEETQRGAAREQAQEDQVTWHANHARSCSTCTTFSNWQ